jgi:hypothetical protein
MAMRATTQQGGLNFPELVGIVHWQTSISDLECLIALQLFELFLDIGKKLEKINDAYKISAKKSKMNVGKPLEVVMTQLRDVTKQTVPSMPT